MERHIPHLHLPIACRARSNLMLHTEHFFLLFIGVASTEADEHDGRFPHPENASAYRLCAVLYS